MQQPTFDPSPIERSPAGPRAWTAFASGVLALLAVAISTVSLGETPADAFHRENAAAMAAMMDAMDIAPSGDIDRDFAAMMIPHHQGAIAMAQAELRHGTNEQLRRIAQGIVVEQRQEIDAMNLALGRPPQSVIGASMPDPAPASSNAPRQGRSRPDRS